MVKFLAGLRSIALLIARVALNDEVDGKWLLGMIEHYVEHGRYWRDNNRQRRGRA